MPDKITDSTDTSPSSETQSAAIHAPSGGFIDIRPLNEQGFIWKESASTGLLLIGFALFTYILFPYIFRKKSQKSKPIISPLEEFNEAELSLLEKNNVSIREYSEELSSIIRRFLDRTFSLSTQKQTSGEIKKQLTAILNKALPLVPSTKKENAGNEMARIISQIEEGIYSDHSFLLDSKEWRETLLTDARNWIHEVSKELERENKRISSVSERASSPEAGEKKERRMA